MLLLFFGFFFWDENTAVTCIIIGGFTPRHPTFDAGGLLDPKDSLRCLFHRGTPPERGSSRLSVEEVKV